MIKELMNSVVRPDSQKPYLGITWQSVQNSYQSNFGWPQGVYVVEISAESPAALAGLRSGDIITSFNGEVITSMEELQASLSNCVVGDVDKIGVARIESSKNGQTEMNTY